MCVGLVAAEHADLRRMLLAVGGPNFSIAAASFDLRELLLETTDIEVDAVICHCGDSLAGVADTVARVRKRLPGTRVVAVTRTSGGPDLRKALAAGLDALVLDSQVQVALAASVRAACAGQLSIPRETRPPVYSSALSHGEREVLASVAAGLTNGEIAARLNISASTVKGRLSNAYSKLGVRSREEAAAAMLENEAGPVSQ